MLPHLYRVDVICYGNDMLWYAVLLLIEYTTSKVSEYSERFRAATTAVRTMSLTAQHVSQFQTADVSSSCSTAVYAVAAAFQNCSAFNSVAGFFVEQTGT
jgi:hypothetical protein